MTYRQNMGVGSASAVAGAVRRLGSRRVNMYFTPVVEMNLTTDLAATRSATVGEDVSFAVVAAGGTAPYSYDWYYREKQNYAPILIDPAINPTAETATLVNSAVTVASTGYYVCEVFDATGQSIFSTEQLLTVNPAP